MLLEGRQKDMSIRINMSINEHEMYEQDIHIYFSHSYCITLSGVSPLIPRGGYIESPVQRNVCGSTDDVIVSHIVLCDEESCKFDSLLFNAPREWQDPKAIFSSLMSGYDVSAVILLYTVHQLYSCNVSQYDISAAVLLVTSAIYQYLPPIVLSFCYFNSFWEKKWQWYPLGPKKKMTTTSRTLGYLFSST